VTAELAPKVDAEDTKDHDEDEEPAANDEEKKCVSSQKVSEEGRKIFIHNVSEESKYEDFQEAVEKFGEVTDFYNTGRGFAFLRFSTREEAEACIACMDNTEVAGRIIQMNMARPKGVEGGDHGGRGGGRGRGRGRGRGGGANGRSKDVEGTKLFVYNVSEETSQADLKREFGIYGTVTDVFNTGKGFAFIAFSTKAEAHAAIAAMDGTEVYGRVIECEIAKPRGEITPGREAGGVGGPGGGRGGRGGRGGFRGGRGGGN